MEENKIYIKQPFREQYTLTIESEVNAINALISSTIEIRYDFQVLEVKDDLIEVRLLVLDNKIVKANNPMVREVAQVSQVFGRMYNELHLQLAHDGQVLKVLNTDLILSKWEETKAEMKKHISGNPEMKQAITLNDVVFNSPEKVKIAVQANEFFPMYFGQIFNEPLPKSKKIAGTNIFNTANLGWLIDAEEMAVNSPEKDICIIVNAHPVRPFSEGYLNAAYHQFKDQIKIDPIGLKMFQREDRYFERETGQLKNSTVKKVEEIDPKKLYQKFTYKMISDTERKAQIEKSQAVNASQKKQELLAVSEKNIEEQGTEIYKVLDGKEYTYDEWKKYEQKQWEIYQEKKNKKGFFGL